MIQRTKCPLVIAKRNLAGTSGLKKNSSSLDYCVNLVKTRSHEQYLSTLLLPSKIRRTGFVVRAFNVEISHIRDQITSKYAGIGRMTFWRGLIHDIYQGGKVANHPLAIELHASIVQVLCSTLEST